MKTVLFTPGFHSATSRAAYQGKAALQLMEQLGYNVVFVPIDWKYRTVRDWTKQLREAYATYDPYHTILAGFSFGAITSLVIAAERQPSELWLFSLSPFFREDLNFQKPGYMQRVIGKHRAAAFAELDFEVLASKLSCPVKILAGSEEMKRYPGIKRRSEAAAKSLHATYVVVEGAKHRIESPPYLTAIKRII